MDKEKRVGIGESETPVSTDNAQSCDFISRELAVSNCREYEDEYFGTVVALPVFALINLPSADVVTRDEYAKVVLERDYAVEELSKQHEAQRQNLIALMNDKPRWIPVTERLPDCEHGAEIGNIEWISCGMVHAGCFGRGGKYRDAYFRTWTDAGEGMDAKDADYWRAVTLPEPPKEE